MGKRGPPKTPLAILAARGSWRADERKEVEVAPGCPAPPENLTDSAKAHWWYIVPILNAANLLRLTDRNSLSRYCELLAAYDACQCELRESPALLRVDGSVNPLIATAIRLSEALQKLEDRFGLNPSARANVAGAVETPKNKNDKAEFFGT